ncbi:hypothetical protein QUF72_08085 [Desulfobacterales bacterium HSG2]|nr:hypothetical protein [Desulfobacterales bacterium HSG2]
MFGAYLERARSRPGAWSEQVGGFSNPPGARSEQTGSVVGAGGFSNPPGACSEHIWSALGADRERDRSRRI